MLVGFLTGVGIQVAIGQVGGMLGIPAPNVASTRFSGDVRKFGLTLWHIGEASWQTTLVSAAVLAILIVFARYVKAVPGGLVAVDRDDRRELDLRLRSATASRPSAPCPSGLPHIGFPQGVTWSDTTALLADRGVALPRHPRAERRHLARLRGQVPRAASTRTPTSSVSAWPTSRAGFSSTFVVNGSPTKTEMVDEAESHTQVAQLTTAVVVAIVLLFLTKPLQYLPNAVLAAVVFLIGAEARRHRGHARDPAAYARTSSSSRSSPRSSSSWSASSRASSSRSSSRCSCTCAATTSRSTSCSPGTSTATCGRCGPAPGVSSEPGLVVYRFGAGIFYANAQRLSDEVLELAGGETPPRWLVLDAPSIDDIDFTGGKTLVELAGAEELGVSSPWPMSAAPFACSSTATA